MERNILTGSTGLNTVVDPVRIQYDYKSGISDLQVAINVTIDRTGRVSRRKGYIERKAGSYHSLWCDGYDCFVASTTNLYRLGADYELQLVRSGLSGDRISFAQWASHTYYSDNTYNGLVQEGVNYAWPEASYIGPNTTREHSNAPIGKHIAQFASSLLIAKNNVVYWSDAFSNNLFDLTRNFVQFGTDVVMVKPVAGGVYVSDEKFTYFLSGATPADFSMVKVCNYPAIEWSEATDLVDGIEAGFEVPGMCALWASTEGACLGTPDGTVINLTREKIIYPAINKTGASIVRGRHFIHTV